MKHQKRPLGVQKSDQLSIRSLKFSITSMATLSVVHRWRRLVLTE